MLDTEQFVREVRRMDDLTFIDNFQAMCLASRLIFPTSKREHLMGSWMLGVYEREMVRRDWPNEEIEALLRFYGLRGRGLR